MSIKIKINNQEYEAQPGNTVLEIAQENGITIPTLCYHKDLSNFGSCRLCLVEVENWRGQVPACTLEVSDGIAVQTETLSIIQSRKLILELLLQNYMDEGYAEVDEHENEFLNWVNHYQVKLPQWIAPKKRYEVNSDPNPFILVDLNKCILCTRCVRACAEVQGRFVWGVGYRGYEAKVIAGADSDLLTARCESCGACVAYCPTGALVNKMSVGLGSADKIVQTTCTYCGVGCQLNLNVKDNKVIRVTSAPDAPVNGMHLCVKGRYGYDFIHHEDRLKKPLVRRYLLDNSTRENSRGEWVEVDWDTALEITADKLRDIRDDYGSDSIGILASEKSADEENYLMNKFARQVIGTNSIDHCARL